MKKIEREQFVQSAIEVGILERGLLTRPQFESMLQDGAQGKMHTILQAAGYRHFPSGDVAQVRFHAMLDEFMSDFLDEVLRISPPEGNEYLDLLFLDYDLHNIQAALMQRQYGDCASNQMIPLPRSRAGRYSAPPDERPSKTQDEDMTDDYYTTLLRGAEEKFSVSPRAAQEWLDIEYYTRLIALATQSGIPMFLDYARAKVDFYNLLSMLRLRRMDTLSPQPDTQKALAVYTALAAQGGTLSLPLLQSMFPQTIDQIQHALEATVYRGVFQRGLALCGYKNDTARLEKEMDDYLTRLVAATRYVVLGPEPLFGYLYARRVEMVNLRLVLAVRLQGLPEAAARERLREEYV